ELQAGTSGLVLVDLTKEVVDALIHVPREQVPEMPDRIIAAIALHLGISVISRDHKIAASVVPTIW
ncbi:MAG: PIN domain-containing protein, partial [Blastocatellia bacterium]